MSLTRFERTFFWIVPATVLVAAFTGLCVMTGTPWPWHEVVHEDGHRTLLGTIFFVEHVTRELIPDAVLALAVAGAVRFYFPPVAPQVARPDHRDRVRLGLLAIIVVSGVAAVTIWTAGVQSLIDNLSQLHTREGAPLVWGAHWRYHLIERFAQMMLAFSAAGAVWLLRGRPARSDTRRFQLFGIALAVFAILTIVFRPTAEPFRDPAFLGHQLRELFTHTLVTLPLALGTCLALANRFPGGSIERSSEPIWPIVVTAALAILCGAFLLIASLMTDAQSHGQTTGLAQLLLPHFFEHTLGYIFVPTLAGWLFLTRASTA